MRARTIIISCEELIKALKLPEDTSIIGVSRNPNTFSIHLSITSELIKNEPINSAILNEFLDSFIERIK